MAQRTVCDRSGHLIEPGKKQYRRIVMYDKPASVEELAGTECGAAINCEYPDLCPRCTDTIDKDIRALTGRYQSRETEGHEQPATT